MKNKWTIEIAEVQAATTGHASGSYKKHKMRADQVRSVEVTLTHVPTKIVVKGTVPEGNYTRTAMAKLKKAITLALLAELEAEVAKALRIPGYRRSSD